MNPTAWLERYFRLRERCEGLKSITLSDDPRVPRDPNSLTALEQLGQCDYLLRRAHIGLRGLAMACLEARYAVSNSTEWSRLNEKARDWLWKHRPEFGAVGTATVKENITNAEIRIGWALRDAGEG